MLTASDLPAEVVEIVRSRPVVQFATVSARGVPIVDAVLPVAGQDGASIDVGTGLAYAGKADRARRHPRVGLHFGQPDGGPVLLIRARAAVRDADLQANTDRWVAAYRDTWMAPDTLEKRWEQAICYFVRIFVNCTPAAAKWWPTGDLDAPPREWKAAPDATFPESDPAPAGKRTTGPVQPEPDWRAETERIFALALPPPVLTRVDPDGYPLPFPTRSARPTADGFVLDIPGSAPWARSGPATLGFEARDANPPGIGGAFVGQLEGDILRVERMLPPNYRAVAYREDPSSHLFQPADIHNFLFARLRRELERRDASVPTIRGLDVDRA